jgi:hypothetical protein
MGRTWRLVATAGLLLAGAGLAGCMGPAADGGAAPDARAASACADCTAAGGACEKCAASAPSAPAAPAPGGT